MATRKHDCRWREEAAKLQEQLAERDAKLAALSARMSDLEHKMALANRQIVGPKSERMPTPEQEAKKREGKKVTSGGYTNRKKRQENAEALAALPATVVPHPVADADRRCPHCGDDIKPIGQGERSVEYEWVPGRLERRVHVVEVGRCPCKLHYARVPRRLGCRRDAHTDRHSSRSSPSISAPTRRRSTVSRRPCDARGSPSPAAR